MNKYQWTFTEQPPEISYILCSPMPNCQAVATFTHKPDAEGVCALLNEARNIALLLTYHLYNSPKQLRELLGEKDYEHISSAYSNICGYLRTWEGNNA